MDSEEARNPSLILQRIREHGVTAILSIVPSLPRAMTEVEMQPNKLRLLMTCGEALNESDYKHARALFGPNVELVNQYGVSEYAMAATYCPLDDETVSQSHHGSLPIGRPVTNAQIYILDNHFNPQPIGVMGELYIGGVGLAQGYLNRPDLTAERFIPHPFSGHAGERLYRTGDAARYLSDGRIQYLGRLDDQVKVRGYRIELGEIEAVLRRHGQVTEAVVVMREDEAGEKRLVAYVVGKDLTVGQLREHLRRALPEYMVPSAFVMLEKLPLTANGKVDRKSLPAPGPERPELESTFTAPHTKTEQKLAKIWRDVLKVEQVGVGDNFFELGGHSLLATQVISRVRDVFQVELPLRNLFETPTIGELAATISEMHSGGMEARAANQIEVISQAELLKQLDEMGKEEVDLLFATMIAGTGNSGSE
jgi:acyl carrier protein